MFATWMPFLCKHVVHWLRFPESIVSDNEGINDITQESRQGESHIHMIQVNKEKTGPIYA